MAQDTRAFSAVKMVYYVLALLVAASIEFISSRLASTDPLKDILHDGAIAIVLAVAGVFVTSLTRRLFDSHAKEISMVKETSRLWQKFGIVDMSVEWQDYRAATGVGSDFRKHLGRFYQDSTWYIVTINPEALAGEFLKSVILPALESGARIKWAYVRLATESDSEAKTLRRWWASQYVAWAADFEQNLSFAEVNLSNNLKQITLLVQQKVENGEIQPDALEIYESQIPTTFLALLAVRNQDTLRVGKLSDKWVTKDRPGIALVDPYAMFPVPAQHHWGMILVSPGELYEQYAGSIIRFFEVGQSGGYLSRVWPKADAAA